MDMDGDLDIDLLIAGHKSQNVVGLKINRSNSIQSILLERQQR